jgi:hypothetical protein
MRDEAMLKSKLGGLWKTSAIVARRSEVGLPSTDLSLGWRTLFAMVPERAHFPLIE